MDNKSTVTTSKDVSKTGHTSPAVQKLLKKSCYNCHSNYTNYPWYAHVQPFSWWLSNHISDGKKELNFSEFGTYNEKKRKKKLKEIIEQVKEDEMPLKSYLLIHNESKLNPQEKKLIMDWAKAEM